MDRKIVESYLNKYLDVDSFNDYSYNGLQFEGSNEVKKIGFAVDAGVQTFNNAVKEGVDLLIVHHGLFWKKQNPVITSAHKRRLDILFENNLSLYAVHLPLDAHEEVGNNVGLVSLLNGSNSTGFCQYGKAYIGRYAEFSTPLTFEEIEELLNNKLGTNCQSVKVNEKPISKFAVISGACSRDELYEASKGGADLLITGEPMEIYHDAHDYGISVLFTGHHASETVGVSLLKKHIEEKFEDVSTTFISCPTSL